MKKILAVFLTAVLIAVCFAGCKNGGGDGSGENAPLPEQEKGLPKKETDILSSMSLEDKLWQLFFVTPEAVSGEARVTSVSEKFTENAGKYKVGGVILFAQNVVDRVQIMKLLGDMSVSFDVPVFLGVDEEGGIVTSLSKNCGVTDNGNMRDVKTVEQARKVGERLGLQLISLGFNMDFAPVADVLVDPDNTEIGPRSFGSDPEDVAAKVTAEVEGMQARGLSSVLKHFPGHGSAKTNSHNGVSVSERTPEQLRAEELTPFKAGVEAGADFVMVSHLSLPNVTGDETPSSLSPAVITGLLRDEIGYEGIVVTDALNMGAVTDVYGPGEASVMAVEAGADMLLMPTDLEAAHAALVDAVKSGRLTEARIDKSVGRILDLKREKGLIK